MLKRTFAALLLFGALAGPVLAQLQVTQGWVRAVPPVSRTSAAYFRLYNPDAGPWVIVGARSPVADKVELHHHVMTEDGLMRMRHLPALRLKSGAERWLAPGGLHLMLMGLKRPLKIGEKVEIQLQLANGDQLSLSLPVLAQAPTP